MLGLNDKVIDEDLQYRDSKGSMVCLHDGLCGLIKVFKAYYTHCITNLDCTFDNESERREITSSKFNQFVFVHPL